MDPLPGLLARIYAGGARSNQDQPDARPGRSVGRPWTGFQYILSFCANAPLVRARQKTTGACVNKVAEYRLGLILVTASAVAWSLAGLFTRAIPLDSWTILAWRGIFLSLIHISEPTRPY